MVRQVDRTVGYIRQKIQAYGLTERLNVIITADHGMTTVLRGAGVNEIILSQIPGFDFKDIKFQLVDYGPAGMLLPKDGLLEKVYLALKGGHPNLHVYKKEDMPARLHFGNHPRLLPLILFADPGYVINGVSVLTGRPGRYRHHITLHHTKPLLHIAIHPNPLLPPAIHTNPLLPPPIHTNPPPLSSCSQSSLTRVSMALTTRA